MLNRISAWAGLALLFAFLSFAATLSSSYAQCRAGREAKYSNKNQPDFFEQADTFIVCEGVAGDANGELLTALATIAVAAFTLTLWRTSSEQARLTRESIKFAGAQSDAAIATERSRFHVIIADHNLRGFIQAAERYDNSPGMGIRGDIRITYRFKNYGKGPGLITEVSHGIRISEAPPDNIVYTVIRQAPKEYMVPSLGETEPYVCEGAKQFDSLQTAIAIRTGRTLVWFFGRFDYVDFVTNRPQVHRFLMRYIRTESGEWRFQTFDHNNYNQST